MMLLKLTNAHARLSPHGISNCNAASVHSASLFKEAILYISNFMYLGLSYVIEHVINGAIMVEGFWTLDTGLFHRITFFFTLIINQGIQNRRAQ